VGDRCFFLQGAFCLIGDDGDDGEAGAVRGRHQVEAAGRRQRAEEVVRGGGGVRQGGEDGQHAGGDTEPAGAEAHRQEPRRHRLHHLPARPEQALLPRLLAT
jgi:hypothetical protein